MDILGCMSYLIDGKDIGHYCILLIFLYDITDRTPFRRMGKNHITSTQQIFKGTKLR